ncbi:Histone acetyltransferase mst2, partial [Neolecta irregularis DAH-3]
HPACLLFSSRKTGVCQSYAWICRACKTCEACGKPTPSLDDSDRDEQSLFCSQCDRARHVACAPNSYRPRSAKGAAVETAPPPPPGQYTCRSCASANNDATLRARPRRPRAESPWSTSSSERNVFMETLLPGEEVSAPRSLRKRKHDTLSANNDLLHPVDSPSSTPKSRKTALKGSESLIVRLKIPQNLQRSFTRSTRPPNLAEADLSKPFGDLLSKADAETSKTRPTEYDRERFQRAAQLAEERRQQSASGTPLPSSTASDYDDHIQASRIKSMRFGNYEIDTWYAAPYPEEYSRNTLLYICEFCLKYMNSDYVSWRHKVKCPAKCPPGDEIYHDGVISVFEVDGKKSPVYCQNLCLLAKMFLDHKTLYYDVEPFLFYVMTECRETGFHFVGYFSKEKRSAANYNVSCIVTLPIHQRKGYGNFLIDFSYLLTKREGKIGSPEKPLSDLGLISYRNYWKTIACRELLEKEKQQDWTSIDELSQKLAMTEDDVISTLENLDCLIRDPVTRIYALRIDKAALRERWQRYADKKYHEVDPAALRWVPYLTRPLVSGDATAENKENEDRTQPAPAPVEVVSVSAAPGGIAAARATAATAQEPFPKENILRDLREQLKHIPPERFRVLPEYTPAGPSSILFKKTSSPHKTPRGSRGDTSVSSCNSQFKTICSKTKNIQIAAERAHNIAHLPLNEEDENYRRKMKKGKGWIPKWRIKELEQQLGKDVVRPFLGTSSPSPELKRMTSGDSKMLPSDPAEKGHEISIDPDLCEPV